jgi:hypothetical protein
MTQIDPIQTYTAFLGDELLQQGPLAEVAHAVRQLLVTPRTPPVLVFDDRTGAVLDLDPRVPAPPPPRKRGRPRLGVEPREITLLPRHWDWLATQPGGASAVLRRLVDEARKSSASADDLRRRTDAAYRFMSAMAGDYAGFEEATRALFAHDREGVEARIADWPRAVREHVVKLAYG